MNESFRGPHRQFLALVLLLVLITGLIPPSISAQEATPEATPTGEPIEYEVITLTGDEATEVGEDPTTTPTATTEATAEAGDPPLTTEETAEAVDPTEEPTTSPTETVEATAEATAEVIDPTMTATTTLTTTTPTVTMTETTPTVTEPMPADSRAVTPAETPDIRGVQGVVRLDVLVSPDKIEASKVGTEDGRLTYTFVYTNTGSQTATGIVVKATWTRFSFSNKSGIWQYCQNQCKIVSSSGPTVTMPEDQTSAPFEYRVADLEAGKSGRFSVQLNTRPDLYPQTGKEPFRPAGSGQLFLNNSSSVTSEDTASMIIVGPVFVPTKTPATNASIYPLETAEFILKVGNATGAGDVIDGRIRADAIDATNIVLVDAIPSGSEYVPSANDGSPTVDTNKKTLTWQIPGPLKPGQSVEYRVTFKKLDVNVTCDKLENNNYSVTSDQMPKQTSTTRYAIKGKAALVKVVRPMVIKSIKAEPGSVIYGESGKLTITVQNFYNQPINGAQLKYTVQSNAYYLPSTATPTPTSAPNGAQLGGEIVWTFNMPAGTMTTPSETTFTLQLRGGYVTRVQSGTGQAQIIAPSGVPSACIATKKGNLPLNARLQVSKLSVTGEFYVEEGTDYSYIIEITNKGSTDATDVTIIDRLPTNSSLPANFSYVTGSAKLNGSAFEPTSVVNGNNGSLTWTGIDIASGDQLTLEYTLTVSGSEFVTYCNRVGVVSGDENIKYVTNSVCVKINPPIGLTKTANKTTTTLPGDQVEFTLSLQNQSGSTYQMALYDRMGFFTFVRQESSNNGTPTVNDNGDVEWGLQNVGPGDTLTAKIVVSLPNVCLTKDYVNEIWFLFKNNQGETLLVRRVPTVRAVVKLTCGTNKIEYSKTADRRRISLQDRVVYTIVVKNANTVAAISNITVVDVLPAGFTFVGTQGSGDVKTTPEQKKRSDDRMQLTWTISSIQAGKTARIIFVAKSGDIVGSQENWVTATAPDLLEAKCTRNCKTVDDEGQVVNYATETVQVEPLHTAEPRLTEENCAEQGATRTYRLSLVNTNDHSYQNTVVTLTLPLGLKYVRALDKTPSPSVQRVDNGNTLVVWRGVTVPAKPENSSSALVVMEIELGVGQVWHDLPTKVETTSPDGAIPLKDGVVDPIIEVCPLEPGDPSIAKEVNRATAAIGDELVYQISLVNQDPEAALTITLQDDLAANLTFVSDVEGPKPSVSGNALTWSDVTVPKATLDEETAELIPGTVVIRFKVRLTSGADGDIVANRIVASPAVMDTTYDTVQFSVVELSPLFMPLIRR